MKHAEPAQVESQDIGDFAKVMHGGTPVAAPQSGSQPPRINLDQDNLKNSLGQLVLTLVKLLHELLERQGIRRIESGSLTEDQIERLGLTLMKQAQEIDRLRREFGLEEEDLNIDLGPLGQLL
jgi:Gas vesicle protein K